VAPLGDWMDPKPAPRSYGALVPQVDADGNEVGGVRLPDIAVPVGTFAGWNVYKIPYPDGELADRDGSFLAFAATDAERGTDPRVSIETRYPDGKRAQLVESEVATLLSEGLLLQVDVSVFLI
jgi:Alpha/beta hydrolase domain